MVWLQKLQHIFFSFLFFIFTFINENNYYISFVFLLLNNFQILSFFFFQK